MILNVMGFKDHRGPLDVVLEPLYSRQFVPEEDSAFSFHMNGICHESRPIEGQWGGAEPVGKARLGPQNRVDQTARRNNQEGGYPDRSDPPRTRRQRSPGSSVPKQERGRESQQHPGFQVEFKEGVHPADVPANLDQVDPNPNGKSKP